MRSRRDPAIGAATSLGALTVHAVACMRPRHGRAQPGTVPLRCPRERIIRVREVLHRVPVNRATIYKWMKEGRFPRQIALGANSAGWYESDIDAWIADPTGWRPYSTL